MRPATTHTTLISSGYYLHASHALPTTHGLWILKYTRLPNAAQDKHSNHSVSASLQSDIARKSGLRQTGIAGLFYQLAREANSLKPLSRIVISNVRSLRLSIVSALCVSWTVEVHQSSSWIRKCDWSCATYSLSNVCGLVGNWHAQMSLPCG